MNILMMTNTYLPHVGGVARSVQTFAEEYRRRGHRVIVVAPRFEGAEPEEEDVIRAPSVPRFNGSDFSVYVPVPGVLAGRLRGWRPDVVHSHHPFLLGVAALKLSRSRGVPLVFTSHTLYDRYTHYVPGDGPALRRFVRALWTGYACLADRVIAPSESAAALLRRQGVAAPIDVVPTGVDLGTWRRGDGAAFRRAAGIPPGAFVVGHWGRLAREKSIGFLVRAAGDFLERRPRAHLLIVGKGPMEGPLRRALHRRGLAGRLRCAGELVGRSLVDAAHAADVFAFASRSETQGMVLCEAMAAGLPVVALDAPGAREVVEDGVNGRLLARPDVAAFAAALDWTAQRPAPERRRLREAARRTAEGYSRGRCAERALAVYAAALERGGAGRPYADTPWERAMRALRARWDILSTLSSAARAALDVR